MAVVEAADKSENGWLDGRSARSVRVAIEVQHRKKLGNRESGAWGYYGRLRMAHKKPSSTASDTCPKGRPWRRLHMPRSPPERAGL